MSADTAVATTPDEKPGLKIPAHLAVIMDGNGRWAKARGLHALRRQPSGKRRPSWKPPFVVDGVHDLHDADDPAHQAENRQHCEELEHRTDRPKPPPGARHRW